MRTAESNRLAHALERVRREIREHMRYLDKRIRELDRELHDRLRGSPLWRDKDDLLRSIPGVGPVLSTTLLAMYQSSARCGTSRSRRWSAWRR